MDKTYTIIPDFMLDYDLTLTETVALAVIYGFCQDGESDFHGSYSYLARKCKVTKSWAIKTVNSLIEKGYITKEVIEKKGVKFCSFRTVFGGGVENTPQVNKIHQGSVESTPGGSVENTPNNIIVKDNRNNRESVFTPPTLEEVRTFWSHYHFASDPDHFYLYFEEHEWKYRGGRKMKDWHKAAAMWEKNEKKYGR